MGKAYLKRIMQLRKSTTKRFINTSSKTEAEPRTKGQKRYVYLSWPFGAWAKTNYEINPQNLQSIDHYSILIMLIEKIKMKLQKNKIISSISTDASSGAEPRTKGQKRYAYFSWPFGARVNIKKYFHKASVLPTFILVGIVVISAVSLSIVKADQYDQQIQQLQQANNQVQQNVNQLQIQASSYQDAINRLQSEINTLQAQITDNQNKRDDLQRQIVAAQAELDKQRKILGEDIKAMYLEGQISTLEMLASSKDLSEFVDKQEYRSSVQDKIKTTMDKITALREQMRQQQAQIDQLLKAQQFQRDQLANDENQQSQLLGYNEAQQANYNKQIAANQAQIASLRRQQAALIQGGTRGVYIPPPSGGSGGACDNGNGNGNYPMSWCNAPQDTVATIPYSSDAINRECTSYAFWYFTQVEGHTDFHVTGDAKYWYNTSNYAVHDAPAVGAIAVETTGYYGHVAIVQALSGQTYAGNTVPGGYVLVSEMNYDWNGHFRYSFSPISKFAGFIY